MAAAGEAAAIVPVRVGSQRLPGKALLAETGTPLFLHTWRQTVAAECFSVCAVATDDDRVAAAAERAGARVLRTSPDCRTGSDRCAEAAAALDCAFVVDVQGDWPEVEPRDLRAFAQRPRDLRALAQALRERRAPCATLAVPLRDERRAADRHVVKVVRGRDGTALYFSREPIPHVQDGAGWTRLRHVGVYGFTREALLAVPGLPSSGLAEAEGLEQLRFLENGMRILVLDAHGEPWGIETRADYDAFRERTARREGGRA